MFDGMLVGGRGCVRLGGDRQRAVQLGVTTCSSSQKHFVKPNVNLFRILMGKLGEFSVYELLVGHAGDMPSSADLKLRAPATVEAS